MFTGNSADVSRYFDGKTAKVQTAEELVQAVQNAEIDIVDVEGLIPEVPPLRLPPRKILRGRGTTQSGLRFQQGKNGVQLSSENVVTSLSVVTSADGCAIWNDDSVETLGTLWLAGLKVVGRVCLLARGTISQGHVEVLDLDIIAADSRAEKVRPRDFGVSVLQGAFTLWNLQPDPQVTVSANIIGVSVGRASEPVIGSGVFVGGNGLNGGSLRVEQLITGPVYTDGRIEPGTADQIACGVFVCHGGVVDLVQNTGPVTTFGPNDMALDNWGTVDRWHAKGKVTTYGPSGIGFVNFGHTRHIYTESPIETFGEGARGFNVYAGTVKHCEFERIVTHGDGAVGLQIGQPVGQITIRSGIETFGSTGRSLVKGVMQDLPAIGLSIKGGGAVEVIEIRGGLRTHGVGSSPLEQSGYIGKLTLEGGWSSSDG